MTSGSLVLGLISGLIYGFLAVGIVLVYKANRFLNLAHAQFGVVSALLMAKFVIQWDWDWWTAFAVTVPLGSLLAVASYQFLIKPLQARTKSTVVLLLASLGIAQFLLTANFVPSLGVSPTTFAEADGFPLPFGGRVKVGGTYLHGDRILTLILVPLLVAALVLVLQYTSFGRQVRAAAANRDEARLCGVPVERVSTVVWAIVGAMSSITAILVARASGVGSATSITGISSGFGPDLLLVALGAAALGGFQSISLALVGGIGLGMVQQITLAETSNAGDAMLAVFVVILAIVLVRGRTIAAAFGSSIAMIDDPQPLRIPSVVARHRVVRHRLSILAAVALIAGCVAPLLPYLEREPNRFLLIMILVFATLSVSLTMLIGWGGQVSLGHVAVAGAGAFITGRLVPGVSLPVALLCSGAVGAVMMLIVGLPALRIRGLSLAVTTLGLAVIAPDWLFRKSFFGSQASFGVLIDEPPALADGLGRPRSMLALYYVALVVLALILVAAHGLRRSRSGRLLIALRDNERATEAFGIAPATMKLALLAASGFIAAMAGTIHALAWRQVSVQHFPAALSLSLLAVPVIGGLGSLSGAVAGAVVLYAPVYFLAPHLTGLFGESGAVAGFQLLLAGLALPLTLLSFPTGIAGAGRRGVQQFVDRMAAARSGRESEAELAAPLQVHGVVLNFGGVRALDGASIVVQPGEIVGLIGPNGAGKSTLINVISGVHQPTEGSVKVSGHEVIGLPANYRQGYGLARSFQDAFLFPGLTVTEVIQAALSRRYRTGFLGSMLWAPWARASERRSRARALELVSRFGLDPWRDALAADLSTGTRRICDLAAQVATGAEVLLLDEPTAGVAQREAEAFGPMLRSIRDELDCSILIVEHDMPLLMGLCDRVYAMELGRVIAEGTPPEIRSNPAVIASYLGTDERAISRSGDGPRPSRSGRLQAEAAAERGGA